jgi:hypothetical protein
VIRKGGGWADHKERADVEYFANRATRIVIDGERCEAGDRKERPMRRRRLKGGKVGEVLDRDEGGVVEGWAQSNSKLK